MTANAAGSNSYTPPRGLRLTTTKQLEHFVDYILSPEGNSVPSVLRSKRAGLPKTLLAGGAPSKLEAEFALQLRAHGVTGWTREFRPIPTRRFRLDFAFEREKVGIECDGGTWSNGRHSRGKGYDTDCEKLALCQLAGWTILKVTGTHLKDGTAIAWTKQALGITG